MDLELQKTLFSLLETLEFPFYEGIKDETYPYGAIGHSTTEPLNTKTSNGYRAYYQINLYSTYNGTKEVKTMANAVTDVLTAPFFVADKQCIVDGWSFRTQQEDHIQHGILEINFKIY